MSGWIKLHRQIRDHWIWADSKKLKFWLDILMEVNHLPQKVVLGYNLVECNRGQTVRSLQGWAERWAVSKDSARHFLMLLQKDNMIVLENLKFTTRITVCNYDIYNTTEHGDQTETKRRPNGDQTEADPNKNIKNIKNEKNEKKKHTFSLSLDFIESEEMRSVWLRWMAYKREIKKPYRTQTGLQQKYNHLVELSGGDPVMAAKIIDQSIRQEWSGLFHLKESMGKEKIGLRPAIELYAERYGL